MEFRAKDKYFSLKRSFERLKKISTNNGNRISNTEAKDAVEDFFNRCYHFKDWLIKDAAVRIYKKNTSVEEYISNSNNLSIAADYCNSYKHAGLDRDPRYKHSLSQVNNDVIINFTPNGAITSGRIRITIENNTFDAFKIASECIKEWDLFLEKNNIVFDNP